MRSVERIVYECIDAALSDFKEIDKQEFYRKLYDYFKISPDMLGQNMDLFNRLMRIRYSAYNGAVQRLIVSLLRERIALGIYPHDLGVGAFSKIVGSFCEEMGIQVRETKKVIETIKSREAQKSQTLLESIFKIDSEMSKLRRYHIIQILVYVANRQEAATFTELYKQLRISTTSTRKSLDLLKAKGLVYEIRVNQFPTKHCITLTPQGKEVAKQLPSIY